MSCSEHLRYSLDFLHYLLVIHLVGDDGIPNSDNDLFFRSLGNSIEILAGRQTYRLWKMLNTFHQQVYRTFLTLAKHH